MSGEAGKPDTAKQIRDAVAKLSKSAARAQTELGKADLRKPADLTSESRPQKPAPDLERFADALRRAEAVLFASGEPIDAATLTQALPQGVESGDVLLRLKADYASRGVHLVEVAGKWRFQSAPDLAFLFEETREQPRALSKAALETLAIIAYCQPVTRAEIEDIRGVAVSTGTLDILMAEGWVRPRGRRRTPGRPVTYGTTEGFLVHFGLDSLDSLPARAELQASGLLSAEIPREFDFAGPPRDPETGDLLPEDPLDAPDFQPDFLEGSEEPE